MEYEIRKELGKQGDVYTWGCPRINSCILLGGVQPDESPNL